MESQDLFKGNAWGQELGVKGVSGVEILKSVEKKIFFSS